MTSTVQSKRLRLASTSEAEPAAGKQQKGETEEYSLDEQQLDSSELPKGAGKNSDRKLPPARATRSCRQKSSQKQQQQQKESDGLGVDDLSDETDQDEDEAEEEGDDYEEEDDDDDDEEEDDDEEQDDEDEDEMEFEDALGGGGLVTKKRKKQQKQQHEKQQQHERQRGANLQDQLAASGPAGVAAAAAIATVRKRKRPHTFETNPSVRKRQQTRLIRKLRACIDEYTARVGQQAVVLITMPGKTAHNFKVFGAQPLESVVRSCKQEIMSELEQAVLEQTPIRFVSGGQKDSGKHELPPLVIDGIPTPVEKMTQAQLRAFIPLMLKYSTGRGKPGWGKESTRPPWWPNTLPWANVRSDARDEDEKQRISWTTTLREIVTNCYKFHGREDLLPIFDEEAEEAAAAAAGGSNGRENNQAGEPGESNNRSQANHQQQAQQRLHQHAGGILRSQRPLGSAASAARLRNQQQQQHQHHLLDHSNTTTTAYYTTSTAGLQPHQQQQHGYITTSAPSGQGNFMQTIQNADGSVSLIQVDPANAQILTLPDGTQVRAVRLQTCVGAPGGTAGGGGGDDENQQQTLVATGDLQLDASQALQEQHNQQQQQQHQHQHHQILEGQQAELGPDGQIILTSEDGTQSCYPMSQLVSIPASVYQQLAATGQPVQLISAENASQLTAAAGVQIHTIQEAQEISAAEAATGAGEPAGEQETQQVDQKDALANGAQKSTTGEQAGGGTKNRNQRQANSDSGGDFFS